MRKSAFVARAKFVALEMRKGGERKLKVKNLECEFRDVVDSIKVWSREGWVSG